MSMTTYDEHNLIKATRWIPLLLNKPGGAELANFFFFQSRMIMVQFAVAYGSVCNTLHLKLFHDIKRETVKDRGVCEIK